MQLAELWGVGVDLIYKMSAAGTLPHFRIGSAVRYDPKDICEWLDVQKGI